MITETFDTGLGVQTLGSFSVNFRGGTEARLLGPHVDPGTWSAAGPMENWKFDTLCVTPGRLSPGADRATVLAAAIYSGRIMDFNFGEEDEPWSIGGENILGWIGDGDSPGKGPVGGTDYTVAAPYTGSFADYCLALVVGGRTNGLDIDATAASISTSALNCAIRSRDCVRDILNKIVQIPSGQVEYYCTPDGIILCAENGDTTNDVFQWTPKVMFGRGVPPSREYGMVSFGAMIKSSFDYRTEADGLAWTNSAGNSSTGGSLSGRERKDFAGATDATINKFLGASDDLIDWLPATTELFRQHARRDEITITTTARTLRQDLKPGDYIYVYDPRRGVIDNTVTVVHGGRSLRPQKKRCAEMRYPILPENGVYVIHNATEYTGTNAVQDVTEEVIPETGNTTVVVRNLPPPTMRKTVLGQQFRNSWDRA